MKLTKSRLKEIIGEEILQEAAKRDYKAEYKKFQSSTKSKKYRAELNAYNKKKGTYGNGDGKDASHKGGKIAGFEKESVNRGRAEKSRLKKEGKLTEGGAWTTSQTKSVDKIDGAFKKLLAKKGIEPYSYEASKLWKRAGFDKKMRDIFGKDESIGEGKLREAIRKIFREDFAGAYPEDQR